MFTAVQPPKYDVDEILIDALTTKRKKKRHKYIVATVFLLTGVA